MGAQYSGSTQCAPFQIVVFTKQLNRCRPNKSYNPLLHKPSRQLQHSTACPYPLMGAHQKGNATFHAPSVPCTVRAQNATNNPNWRSTHKEVAPLVATSRRLAKLKRCRQQMLMVAPHPHCGAPGVVVELDLLDPILGLIDIAVIVVRVNTMP